MHQIPGICKLPSAGHADLIRTPPDGEHTAELVVVIAKQKLQERSLHTLCALTVRATIRKIQNDRLTARKSVQDSSHNAK
jgi:hypothetical protein